MFHEYALDPAALSSWDRVRYFLDAMGPWKGRFLAHYPSKWKRKVFEAYNGADVEKHRVIERLRVLDSRVFSPRTGASYDGSRSWLDNARIEHERMAFRAIISQAVPDNDGVFLGVHIDEQTELWRVPQGRLLQRDPKVFAEALALLLRASKHVAIVDPYFRADQADKVAPLIELCRVLQGVTGVAVDVHTSDEAFSYGESKRQAERVIPIVLSARMAITLHIWRPRTGGGRFHNRYLLTDVGGVQFGDAIERGEQGHLDRVSILGEEDRASLWRQLYGEATAFDRAGQPIRIEGQGKGR